MRLLTGALRAARDNKRFLVGMSLLLAFRACIADWAVVPSGSMNPTLIEGDYILMNRLAYGVRVPATTVWLKRGDEPRRGGGQSARTRQFSSASAGMTPRHIPAPANTSNFPTVFAFMPILPCFY